MKANPDIGLLVLYTIIIALAAQRIKQKKKSNRGLYLFVAAKQMPQGKTTAATGRKHASAKCK